LKKIVDEYSKKYFFNFTIESNCDLLMNELLLRREIIEEDIRENKEKKFILGKE
jgi:hypothetical protein